MGRPAVKALALLGLGWAALRVTAGGLQLARANSQGPTKKQPPGENSAFAG
jgi:hypothetical protein